MTSKKFSTLLLPKSGNFFELFEAHATTVLAASEATVRVLAGGPDQAQHIFGKAGTAAGAFCPGLRSS